MNLENTLLYFFSTMAEVWATLLVFLVVLMKAGFPLLSKEQAEEVLNYGDKRKRSKNLNELMVKSFESSCIVLASNCLMLAASSLLDKFAQPFILLIMVLLNFGFGLVFYRWGRECLKAEMNHLTPPEPVPKVQPTKTAAVTESSSADK
jgi:hypothetical protein